MSDSDHSISSSIASDPPATNLADSATTQQIPVTERDFNRQATRRLLGYALLAFLAVGLLMAVLASSGSGISQAVDVEAKLITVTLSQEPPQLNSTKSTDRVSNMVIGHIGEGLLRYDKNNELAPGVATRWEITETNATFWLRPDARWSNGEPVTAHDFVFAWQQVADPATASQYAFFMYPIKNGEAISNGELPRSKLGVEALDDLTLKVTLEKPIAYFRKLVAYSTFYPLNQAFFESTKGRYGADADTILYNGPFVISSWVHGASLRMDKNPQYWDRDRIKLDTIDSAYITGDSNAIFNLFKANSIAFASLRSESLTDALNQRYSIKRFMDGSIWYIEFNHRDGRPTTNLNLRKALQLVNNPTELVNKVYKIPGNLPGESLFPVWLRGVNGFFRQEYPAPVATRDIKLARKHLELAKQELGLKKLPVLMLLSDDTPDAAKQAEYYQDLLRRTLGLDVRLDKQIFKQRLEKSRQGEFDLLLAGWGPDFDDPLTFGDLMSSWNLQNRGRYASPEVDRWVRVAQNSLDPKVRMDAFGQIQNLLFEDAALLYNYERGQLYVTHPQLRGLVRRAVGPDPDYSNAYLVADGETL